MTQTNGGETMKLTLNILATLIFLAGLIWFLQGINILPGSFMTGDPQWTINGAMMMAVALVIFFFANRRTG
jgi:hypothetical protein